MNVQQTIIKGIKEQLYSNNYLVLPGFGGFVLKSRPSHFSASGGSLLPPSKSVSFNSQLKQNDGILALWLQNKLNCAGAEALNHLNDFSGFCSGVLSAKRRLTLDGLGFFFIDFENNICFEPQQDANFLSESFGLLPLSLKPLMAEQLEATKESFVKQTVFVDRRPDREEIQTPVSRSKRNFKGIINTIVVAVLSFSLLILIVTSSKSGGLIHSSVFDRNGSGVYTPITYSDLTLPSQSSKNLSYVADANGIAILELADNKSVSVLAIETKLNTSSAKIEDNSRFDKKGYEIVLGCFTVFSNAQRMNKQLQAKNIQNTISSKNAKGMYVISDGNYDSKEAALEKLQDLKVIFPKAWIKKRD